VGLNFTLVLIFWHILLAAHNPVVELENKSETWPDEQGTVP